MPRCCTESTMIKQAIRQTSTVSVMCLPENSLYNEAIRGFEKAVPHMMGLRHPPGSQIGEAISRGASGTRPRDL